MVKKLIIVCGHPDKDSLAASNAEVLKMSAESQGLESQIFFAYDFPLLKTDPSRKGAPADFDEPVRAMLEADYFAFVTPMWNFSVPGGLKNFLDGVVQQGQFFEFTDSGQPKGLLKTKKLLVVWTSGGPTWIYGTVLKNVLFGQLKSVFKFCGVGNVRQMSLGNVMGTNSDKEKKAIKKFHDKLRNYKF